MNNVYEREILTAEKFKQLNCFDIMIYASVSDYRCKHASEQIIEQSGSLGKQNIEIRFDESTQFHSEFLRSVKPSPEVIKGPMGEVESILNVLVEKIGQASSLLFDITGFPKPYIFSLLKLFQEIPTLRSCKIIYTEPQDYAFGRNGFLDYSSTEGPLEAREINGFGGDDDSTANDYLVVCASFDGDLTNYLLEEMSPDSVYLLNGFPSYNAKFKDISLINNEKLINTISYANILNVCANNPFAVYNELARLNSNLEDAKMCVIPLGPKPMALGIAMFALENDDVRIVYPTPQDYLPNTTIRACCTWLYDVTPVLCSIS